MRALASLARLTGKDDISKDLQAAFDRQRPAFNQTFWSPEKKAFAFALDQRNRRVDELSVLTTVPMWFGLTDEDKSQATIQQLADADLQTDWGTRIISNRSPIYNGSGYHFGSVWPLFTGWASVGEYRYHQPLPAYANLRSNALLALDGSLGHVTEVLSGNYYQPLSTSSPHQIWSAAMVISPILRGMLGLEIDAQSHHVTLAPHVPADWRSFNPGFSSRTDVVSVELNGHSLPFHAAASASDQHVAIRFPLTQATSTVRIRLKNDFGVSLSNVLPALGSASQGLRVLSETWNSARTQLTLSLSGLAGKTYELFVWNPSQVASVKGAKLGAAGRDSAKLVVEFPSADTESYVHQDVVLNFARPR